MAQLVILVSDTLRRRDFLEQREDQKDVLTVGDRHLTVQKEFPTSRDPWNELKKVLVERILRLPDWKSATVRIAAHASTCFGQNRTDRRIEDQRYPAEEKSLHERLGYELDVQIYGFHHEDPSNIWRVVMNLKEIVTARDETRKLNFFQQLEAAFLQQSAAAAEAAPLTGAQRMWEELSVTRHQIIGLFDPMRLRLESAQEKDPVEAAAIRVSVESSLDSKREKAQSLLRRAQKFAPGEASVKCITELQTHLDDIDLQRFTLWLRSLDDKLNHFRSTATGRQ